MRSVAAMVMAMFVMARRVRGGRWPAGPIWQATVGVAARAPWGWHRLEPEWAQRVVDGAPIASGDLVLDLGAGAGALVRPLLAVGCRVVAVELDDARAAQLRREFVDDPVTVVQVDLRDLRLPGRGFRTVASPPYALSTEVVRLLTSTDRLLSADLVLQRSAARRLASDPPPGRHARRYVLSLGMTVPRRAFAPAPQVDSVVLRVRRR